MEVIDCFYLIAFDWNVRHISRTIYRTPAQSDHSVNTSSIRTSGFCLKLFAACIHLNAQQHREILPSNRVFAQQEWSYSCVSYKSFMQRLLVLKKELPRAVRSFISGGEDGVVALCGPLLLNIVCCSCSPGSRLIVSWVPQRSQLHWNFRVLKKSFFHHGVILSFGLFWSIGDVNVGMVDRGGQLEVEVNQARGLTPKPGSKNIPGTHFLMKATILRA